MRGFRLGWTLVVVACGGLLQCSPSGARVSQAPRLARPPVVAAPPRAKAAAKRPLPATACAALLAQYKRKAAKIPYPANLPIRAMLPVGEKLVRRYRLRSGDEVCVALLRMTVGRFFARGPLPDGVPPVKVPGIAGRSRR